MSPFPHVVRTRPDFEKGRIQVWITEPLGLVTRMTEGETVLDVSMLQVIELATVELLRHHGESPQPMIFAHDLRDAAPFTGKMRVAFAKWGLDLGRDLVGSVDVLIRPNAHPLVRMGVSASRAVFRAASFPFEVHEEVEAMRSLPHLVNLRHRS